MAKNIGKIDGLDYSKEDLEIAKELLKYNKAINSSVMGYLEQRKKIIQLAHEERVLTAERQKLVDSQADEDALKLIDKRIKKNREELIQGRLMLANVSKMKIAVNELNKYTAVAYGGMFTMLFSYLTSAQKDFKNINREIGLSGVSSNVLMNNLNNATEYAHSLGMEYKDLTEIQSIYSKNLGKANILTKQNIKDISTLKVGLGLTNEQSASIVANFNNIGYSVNSTKKYFDEMLISSRKFGVNVNKVFELINTNLRRAQTFNFRNGIRGLSEMAQYSAKFRINMDSVFNAMDKARSLDGAIEMAANLQLLGGRFSQMDAFKLLFDARNNPMDFAKSLNEVTKGMATFNKTTGEFQINAGNLDRLRLFAEATGQDFADLVQQSKEVAKMDSIANQLIGKNLSKEQKEFLQGVAQIQSDGSFKVDLGRGFERDIRRVSRSEINKLMIQKGALDEAAKNAQSFNDVWRNTINELKSALLPTMKTLNEVTKWLNENKGLVKGLLAFGAGVFVLNKGINLFNKTALLFGKGSWFNLRGKGSSGAIDSSIGGKTTIKGIGGVTSSKMGSLNKFLDRIKLGSKEMLAFGASFMMVSGGVWIITDGLSKLGDTFSKLNNEQIKGFNETLVKIGGAILVLSSSMLLAGTIGTKGAVGIGIFSAGILAIGFGIKLATEGIAKMVVGVSTMTDSLRSISSSETLSSIRSLHTGFTNIAGGMLLVGRQANSSGFNLFLNKLHEMNNIIDSSKFNSFAVASESLSNFTTSLNSINESKLDKLLSLSNSFNDFTNLSKIIDKLEKIMNKEVKLSIDRKDLEFNFNITNDIDGYQLSKKISRHIPTNIRNINTGNSN